MIVLGIDTSGYANAIGVVDGGNVLADIQYEARHDSLEKIVTNIDTALRSAGITLGEVGGIGVGLGPGSWTGIRVGVTVGKTLAFATGRPVAGVTTLAVLAYGAGKKAVLVCPVIDAGAGDAVYAAFYRVRDSNLVQEGDYYVGDVPGLASLVKEPVAIAGQEAEKHAAEIHRIKPDVDIMAVKVVPGGADVARLAAGRLEKGEVDDALSLTPLYLKESTAKAFTNKYARCVPAGD